MLAPLDRKAREDLERLLLDHDFRADIATRDSDAKRKVPEEHENRTAFEHDRDRILWSPSFRRLANKTQVFLFPENPLAANRLTHSLFVMQVSKGIGSYLRLNIPLIEAIAYGHDDGHVPFGHSGEPVLSERMAHYLRRPDFKFHHTWNGIRVLDELERDGKGFNLTDQVKDGILYHSKGKGRMDKGRLAYTPEGRCVMQGDKIAYTFMDIQNSVEDGVISEDQLPSELQLFGPTLARRIGRAIHGVVTCSLEAINDPSSDQNVCWHGESYEAFEHIKGWMYDNVYENDEVKKGFDNAQRCMASVFDYIIDTRFGHLDQEEAAWKTLDTVAEMTDSGLMRIYTDNFMPRGFR